jgi:tetratricopeptide (TPR) repeat protein
LVRYQNSYPVLRTIFLLTVFCLFIIDVPQNVQAQSNPYVSLPDYKPLWEKGEYQKALEQLQEHMDARPELQRIWSFRYVHWMLDRAALYAEIGKIDEAIEDLEWVYNHFEEPVINYRLAVLYKQKGRMEDYERILNSLSRRSTQYWRYFDRQENLLALAKLSEMQGENPRQLLNTLYSALMKNYPEFANGFVGAGDLSLSKRAYDLAEKYYSEALTVDERNQNALAGLAETYWKSNDPRIEEHLETLMEINPNSVRGIALQAELLLDRGEAEDALEKIEEGLAVNPNSLHLLSLKAGAFFLQDELEAMQKLQEATLDFNPYASEVYSVPGRIASRHYRFKEAAEMQRKALEVNPEDSEAKALLGMDLLRLGDEEEGKRVLEEAFEKDPYHVHAYNMLNLMDSLNHFDRVNEGDFILQLPRKETDVIAQDAINLLTEAIATYQEKYDIDLEKPVHVQIFDDHDDFMVRSLGLPGHIGFLGICFGKLVTMDSPTARPKGGMNWHSVLWHEFVHVITLQKTNNRMPRWLSEGISVYEETQKNKAWGQKLDVEYKVIIDMDDLPGVHDLEIYFTQPKTSLHLMLGYFLAGEFVQCYVDTYGFDALKTALADIGAGMDTYTALTSACGNAIEQIDESFATYLEKRLSALKNIPEVDTNPHEGPTLLERIFQQEPDQRPWLEKESPFTDALRKGREAFEQENWEDAEKSFREAYALYPEYEGSHNPLEMLVALYEKTGQREKQIETLWIILNTQATALTAAYKLVRLLEEEQRWEEMLKAIDLTMAIDPFDLNLRTRLLQGSIKTQNYELALNTAKMLAKLDPPHRSEYRLREIDILAEMDEWQKAKMETLQLLEEFPHFWQAQKRLLTILENETSIEENL